jgi:hypothetical protein
MKLSTDLVAVSGLSIALIVGVVIGAPAELLTGIAGGLSGYLSKTIVSRIEESAREKSSHE